jgi:WD40 repeat protein
MRKLLFLLSLLAIFTNIGFAQNQEKTDVATLKLNLPEFRNASIWRGRTGLTLFSDDGKYVAVSAKTADVAIYDTNTGNLISKIDGHGFWAFSFSPDGKNVIIQSAAETGYAIFETETGKKIRTVEGFDSIALVAKGGGGGFINEANGVYDNGSLEMQRVSMSPNWKSILVNKNDKEYAIYDFETGKLRFELPHAKYSAAWALTKLLFAPSLAGSVSNASFSPNGKFIAITSGNKNPTLWEAETGKLLNKFESKSRIFFFQFSPESSLIATSDYDGFTKIWDCLSGKEITSFGAEKFETVAMFWNNHGNLLYAVTKKGDLTAYDATTGKAAFSFDKSATDRALVSFDKKRVITIPRKDKTILFQVWDVETGKLIKSVPVEKGQKKRIFDLKWSPDNRYFATTEWLKNPVKLWSADGELRQTLNDATFPIFFSKDSKLMATGGKTKDPKIDTGVVWTIQ